MIWWQKSRSDRLVSGERNTRYYHRVASVCGQRKRVNGLQDDDNNNWTFDESAIEDLIVNFFKKLYTKDGVSTLVSN